MDIQKFQEKLAEICELGEKSGKILKPQQIKECFGEMDLDKSQLNQDPAVSEAERYYY